MDIEVQIEEPKQLKLSDDQQTQVVNFIKTAWTQGKDARKKYEINWKACEKAYLCEPDPYNDPQLEWRSNAFLPWSYNAVEAWYSYMYSTLIPRNEKLFTMKGRADSEHPGAHVMEGYLQHRFNENKMPEQMAVVLRQLARKNHTAAKVYWRETKVSTHEWVDQPIMDTLSYNDQDGVPVSFQIQSGTKKVRQENVVNTFSGVVIDPIDIDNFVFFPIYGDMARATKIHETYKYYEDLKATADADEGPIYFNIDKISLEDEKEYGATHNLESRSEQAKDKQKDGLNIKEAWIPRIKLKDASGKEQVYRNYVGTMVNDKWLIRFQPNPYPDGRDPFLFAALNPDGTCNYGYGLLSPAISLQKSANFFFNCKADILKVGIYGGWKYYEDGVFNPYHMIARPGMLVQMANPESAANNLVPLNENIGNIQIAYTEIAELRNEFEETTVPKIVKGQIEESDTTATEIGYAQNNSAGKMHVQAQHINHMILKPLVEMSYLLVYQRAQFDPEVLADIARITQDPIKMVEVPMGQNPDGSPIIEAKPQQLTTEELVAKLPPFLPLPEVDIDVIGYENQIAKQETLHNLQVFGTSAVQSPAGKYIKWYDMAKLAAQTMDLDVDMILVDEEGAKQADQAEAQAHQMQAAAMQAEQQGKAQQVQLQAMAHQQDAQNAQVDMQHKFLQSQLEARQQDTEQMNIQAEMAKFQAELQQKQEQQQIDFMLRMRELIAKEADMQVKNQLAAMSLAHQHEQANVDKEEVA